jgi:hypothetical protein
MERAGYQSHHPFMHTPQPPDVQQVLPSLAGCSGGQVPVFSLQGGCQPQGLPESGQTTAVPVHTPNREPKESARLRVLLPAAGAL